MAPFTNEIRTIFYVYEDGGIEIQVGPGVEAGSVSVGKYGSNATTVDRESISAGESFPLKKGIWRLLKAKDSDVVFRVKLNQGDVVSVNIKDDYPDTTIVWRLNERFLDSFGAISRDDLHRFDPPPNDPSVGPADEVRDRSAGDTR